MRVWIISVDMEGIAGVSQPAPTARGDSGYPAAVELMVGEANAAIEGALDRWRDGDPRQRQPRRHVQPPARRRSHPAAVVLQGQKAVVDGRGGGSGRRPGPSASPCSSATTPARDTRRARSPTRTHAAADAHASSTAGHRRDGHQRRGARRVGHPGRARGGRRRARRRGRRLAAVGRACRGQGAAGGNAAASLHPERAARRDPRRRAAGRGAGAGRRAATARHRPARGHRGRLRAAPSRRTTRRSCRWSSASAIAASASRPTMPSPRTARSWPASASPPSSTDRLGHAGRAAAARPRPCDFPPSPASDGCGSRTRVRTLCARQPIAGTYMHAEPGRCSGRVMSPSVSGGSRHAAPVPARSPAPPT